MIESSQLFVATLMALSGIVGSFVLVYALRHARLVTDRTQTNLDESLVRALSRPLRLLAISVGFGLAFRHISPNFSIGPFGYPTFLEAGLYLLGAYTLTRVLIGLISWHEQEGARTGEETAVFGFLNTLVLVLVWSFGFLLAIRAFGVDVTAMLAGLGVAGIAVAFALKNTLEGIFAAVYMALDKPIRAGDFIKPSNGTEGYVEDITMRSTRLRTRSKNIVVVPNTELSKMIITNYFLPNEQVKFSVPLQVDYAQDLDHVERVTIEVAKEVLSKHEPVEQFEPYVRYDAFSDSGISLRVKLCICGYTDKSRVRHVFIKALKKRYQEEGIVIPYPHTEIHLEQENEH